MSGDRLWNLIQWMQEDQTAGELASVESYIQRLPACADALREEHARLAQAEVNPGMPSDLPPIGHYRLLQLLGRGAQGSVFLAEDTRHPRKVALKVLPPWTGRSVAAGIRRLQREGEALAKLAHPALCRLIDSGETDGAPYLVTEFVDGLTLRALLSETDAAQAIAATLEMKPQHPRSWKDLLQFFRTCAEALHTAHLAGIIHRDIKPGNLMVTRRGDPMVLDFGLAQDDTRASTRLTRTGSALGTPAYMAPELLGDATPSPRTDLYSLAATLYECATGCLPHAGDNFAQVLRSVEEREPVPVRRLNPALPKELEVVLGVAMAKDPRQRYADMRAFAEDLKAICERRPIQARRLGFGLRAQRWVQRHPVWTTLCISASVLLGMRAMQTGDLLEEKQRGLVQAERDKYLLAARLLEKQQPSGATYLARVAMEVKADSVARSALLSSLHRLRVLPTASRLTGASSPREAYDPVSGNILACNLDGNLQLTRATPLADGMKTFPLPTGDWFGRRDDEMGGRIALSPGGTMGAIAPNAGPPWVVHLESGSMLAMQGPADVEVLSLSFTHDRKHLASAWGDGYLRVYDTETGTISAKVLAHEGFFGFLEDWSDAGLIVTGSPGGHRAGQASDRWIRFWSLDSASDGALPLVAEQQLEGFLSSVHIDRQRSRVFVGDSEGNLLAFARNDLSKRIWERRLPNRVHAIDVSEDGLSVACGFGFNPDRPSLAMTGATLFSWQEDFPPISLSTGDATCTGVVFLPDSGHLAVQDWAGWLRLFHASGEEIWSHQHAKLVARSLAWSREQGCFVVTPRLGTPRLIYLPGHLVFHASLKPVMPAMAPPRPEEAPDRVIASWLNQGGRHLMQADGRVRSFRSDGSYLTRYVPSTAAMREVRVAPGSDEMLMLQANGDLLHLRPDGEDWLFIQFPFDAESEATQPLMVPAWESRMCLLRDSAGNFHLLNLDSDTIQPASIPRFLTPPLSMAVEPGGGRIAIGTEEGEVHVLDCSTLKTVTLPVSAAMQTNVQERWLRMPRALAFSKSDTDFTVVLGPSLLQTWNLTTSPPSLVKESHPLGDHSESDQVAVLTNGEIILANRSRRSLFLLGRDGSVRDRYVLSTRATISGLYSWGDGHLVVPTREGALFTFKVTPEGFEAISIVPIHHAKVVSVQRSLDGAFLLTRSIDGHVAWWPFYPEQAYANLAVMNSRFGYSAIPGLLGSAGVRMGIPPHEWAPMER